MMYFMPYIPSSGQHSKWIGLIGIGAEADLKDQYYRIYLFFDH